MKIQSLLVAATIFALATSIFASTFSVHAQSPDFNIVPTPLSQCVEVGASASYSITVSSSGGFTGTVLLDDSIDPSVTNGPTLSSIPSSVNITPDQSATFSITASTTQSTPNQIYAITINGLSGVTVHSATIYLAFKPLCGAAGGITAPVNTLSLVTPFAIAAAVAILATGAVAAVYTRQRKPD